MVKALFLILNPAAAWERIVRARRGLGFVLIAYLLPMVLTASIGEGLGMAQWRTWYVGIHGMIPFTFGETLVFEATRLVLTVVVVAACAYIIWLLREPFCSRYNYGQALKVVIYSLSPLFLFRLVNGAPWINLWIPWVIGVFFSLKILYHGMPCMLKSDPGHALGLYLVSCAVILGLTGAERYIFIQCLTSQGVSINNTIFDIAAQLPF